MSKMKEMQAGQLAVHIFDERSEMGEAAAVDAAQQIKTILDQKEFANLVFAAAPSQSDLLVSLLQQPIDWSRVNAFHMDEYIGIADEAPQRFGNFLKRELFDLVPMHSVHYLYEGGIDPQEAVRSYVELMAKNPPDLVFLGIGENGHLAFNDPHVADFKDPYKIKIVELDDVCRQQQVNDGCFESSDCVPAKAITLTIPALLEIPHAIAIVPGERKADAVYKTVFANITTDCPASALRNHPQAVLYTDKDGGARILRCDRCEIVDECSERPD